MAASFDPILGDLRLMPEVMKIQVKGNVFRGIAKYVQTNFDKPSVAKVISSLPPETQRLIEVPPLASAWMPITHLNNLMRAVIEVPFKGDVMRVRGLSAQIARDDLRTVYKILLKMLSGPSFLLGRIGTVFDMYFKGPQMNGQGDKTGHAVVTLTGPMPFYYCMHAVPGWLDAALEIYQAQNRIVKHTSCVHKGDEACKWDVYWE